MSISLYHETHINNIRRKPNKSADYSKCEIQRNRFITQLKSGQKFQKRNQMKSLMAYE